LNLQYTAISFNGAPIDAGIVPSIGSVGDALGNALIDSAIGSTRPSRSSIRIGPTPGADVPR
jgi:hypothetical protein